MNTERDKYLFLDYMIKVQRPELVLMKRPTMRLIDKRILIFAITSFALLLTKFLGEWIVEALIKR